LVPECAARRRIGVRDAGRAKLAGAKVQVEAHLLFEIAAVPGGKGVPDSSQEFEEHSITCGVPIDIDSLCQQTDLRKNG
jgi:hypothetical protein